MRPLKNAPAFPLTNDAISYGNKALHMQGMTMMEYFAAHEKSEPPKAWLVTHFKTDHLEISGVTKREALVKWRFEVAAHMVRVAEALRRSDYIE